MEPSFSFSKILHFTYRICLSSNKVTHSKREKTYLLTLNSLYGNVSYELEGRLHFFPISSGKDKCSFGILTSFAKKRKCDLCMITENPLLLQTWNKMEMDQNCWNSFSWRPKNLFHLVSYYLILLKFYKTQCSKVCEQTVFRRTRAYLVNVQDIDEQQNFMKKCCMNLPLT